MKNKIKFITIGSDPEFFVLDPQGNPYPATLFAKGNKNNPSPIESLGKGFFEQRDNLSFEGNIPQSSTKDEFITNISKLRQYFINKVSEFDYSLSNNGVEYFAKRYLDTPEGQEFGCSEVVSSWDSTNRKLISRPTPKLHNVKYRVSGFHIHIGYDNFIFDNKIATDILIGRLFDLFVTIPSQIIKPEPERIQSYGKYGMIRIKHYGVECRTLSTFFTQESKLSWVWDQVMKIEQFINSTYNADLMMIIDKAYITGNDKQIKRIFKSIINNFNDTKTIENFNEIKELL